MSSSHYISTFDNQDNENPSFSTWSITPTHPLPVCLISCLQSLSPVHTLLHGTDLRHASATAFPGHLRPQPGVALPPNVPLLLLLLVVVVRPLRGLPHVPPGPAEPATLEEGARAEARAEADEGEALAAMLLLEDGALGVGPVSVGAVVGLLLLHAVSERRAKQPGHVPDLRLHLNHQSAGICHGGTCQRVNRLLLLLLIIKE